MRLLGFGIRLFEITLTVICLALSGYVVHIDSGTYATEDGWGDTITHTSSRNARSNYGVAVSVICLVYLLIIVALTFIWPSLLTGVMSLILETIFWILWLSAFAVFANSVGGLACEGFTTCEVGQAYAAFSFILFFFFFLTSVWVATLVRRNGLELNLGEWGFFSPNSLNNSNSWGFGDFCGKATSDKYDNNDGGNLVTSDLEAGEARTASARNDTVVVQTSAALEETREMSNVEKP